MYELLVYIHVVAAVIWVGGAIAIQVLAVRAQRSDDPADLPTVGKYAAYLGTRVFMPASITLFVAGLIMVAQAWSFGELWIAVAMGLWILSVLVGALYLGPRAGKVGALFAEEGPNSTAARAALDRVFLVSRLELLSFAVIIALMVFKPGSGAS